MGPKLRYPAVIFVPFILADSSPYDPESELARDAVPKTKSRLNVNYTELFKKIWVMAFVELAVFTVTFAYAP